MYKKAQGLPLNLIVLAIVAVVILVLVLAFTVGGAGSTFGRIGKVGVGAGGEEINIIRDNCRQACSEAQNSVDDGKKWESSDYCHLSQSIDLDADGKIGANEKNLKCWGADIGIDCFLTFNAGGKTKKVDTDILADPTKCQAKDVIDV